MQTSVVNVHGKLLVIGFSVLSKKGRVLMLQAVEMVAFRLAATRCSVDAFGRTFLNGGNAGVRLCWNMYLFYSTKSTGRFL